MPQTWQIAVSRMTGSIFKPESQQVRRSGTPCHLGIAEQESDRIQDDDAAKGDVLVFGKTEATRTQCQIDRATTPTAQTRYHHREVHKPELLNSNGKYHAKRTFPDNQAAIPNTVLAPFQSPSHPRLNKVERHLP